MKPTILRCFALFPLPPSLSLSRFSNHQHAMPSYVAGIFGRVLSTFGFLPVSSLVHYRSGSRTLLSTSSIDHRGLGAVLGFSDFHAADARLCLQGPKAMAMMILYGVGPLRLSRTTRTGFLCLACASQHEHPNHLSEVTLDLHDFFPLS